MAEQSFFSELAHYRWQVATFTLLVLLIASVVTDGFANLQANNAAPSPAAAGGAPEVVLPPIPDPDAHAKGDADAPVVIQEWSDFQCPFCSRFALETLPSIMQTYVDTGKVRFEYHHFPLSFHPQALKAAVASECAGEQSKFWEMHDKIFAGQATLADGSYATWAKELALDETKFSSCMSSGKFNSAIQQDMATGQAAGISGTPGFLINGKFVSGAQPFSVFEQVIDAEL